MHLGTLGVDNARVRALAKRAEAKASAATEKSKTRGAWVPVVALVAGVVVLGIAGAMATRERSRKR